MSLIIAATVAALLATWFFVATPRRPRRDNGRMPPFIGGIPVLGSMLKYNKDPKQFVLGNGKKHGIYTIDLAGRDAVIISDRVALETYYNAPEHHLSAVAAMHEMNFALLLGDVNIDSGTYSHRKILVRDLRTSVIDELVARFRTSFERALPQVFPEQGGRGDLFGGCRTIFLNCIIETFIGKEVLDEIPEFVGEYYKWHDYMEEAAGISIISPRFIARPLSWRKKLIAKLRNVVDKIWEKGNSKYLQELKAVDPQCNPERATEYYFGILFAAHKNPSIGAAQVLCHLMENPEALQKVVAEYNELNQDNKHPVEGLGVEDLQQRLPYLAAVVWETLRLCSHTLGSARLVQKEPLGIQTSDGRSFELPVGTMVLSAPLSLSLDEKYFAECEKFDPERHLAPRNEPAAHKYSFAPFSNGVHGCPGRPLAVMMIQYCVLSILTKRILSTKLPLPAKDFHKATVAQRAAPVVVEWTRRVPK